MKVSVSFLSEVDRLNQVISQLEHSSTDFIHLDIMDGYFVPNQNGNIEIYKNLFASTLKPLDVHLMVNDVRCYVDFYSQLHPAYITFHYESGNDVSSLIEYIHATGCQCGVSIKPDTDVSCLLPYLSDIDLVLVMSVEPGRGGQTFMKEVVSKIDFLAQYRQEKDYHYFIEVDGGINEESYALCQKADILVSGSYIFQDENYDDRIRLLQKRVDMFSF